MRIRLAELYDVSLDQVLWQQFKGTIPNFRHAGYWNRLPAFSAESGDKFQRLRRGNGVSCSF